MTPIFIREFLSQQTVRVLKMRFTVSRVKIGIERIEKSGVLASNPEAPVIAASYNGRRQKGR
jgi:hypothetical protein